MAQDKKIYQKGQDLFIKNEDGSFKKIVDQAELENLVFQQGYIDERQELPDLPPMPQNLNTANNNTGVDTGEVQVPKLPEELNFKLYQATGSIRPDDQTIAEWEYNPVLFEQKLDDLIKQSQEKMTAEQKKIDDENALKSFQEQAATSATAGVQKEGRFSLIKFQSDPQPNDSVDDTNTIWLFDSKNKTYRPFASPEAMESFFGKNYEEVMSKKVKSLPTEALNNPDFMPKEFFERKYAVQNDGSMPPVPGFEDSQESSTSIYGKTRDANLEDVVSSYLSSIFTDMKNDKAITEDTFNKYMHDPTNLARYISAVAYGDYSFGAIYRDVKAKELADQGNKAYEGFKAFDERVDANKWYGTEEGKKSLVIDNDITPPQNFGMDASLFNNPIFKIPTAAFKTLVQPIDWNSQEFKDEAENIQAAYYDIMTQKAEAQTEQARMVAQNNWDMFKKSLDKKYNIQLSDNANAAWGQLQNLFSGYSEAGLSNSGLLNESMDRYLAEVRKSDSRARETKMTDEETQKRNFLLKSGTPEQIAAFTKENPDLAQSWGLIPTQETKDWYSKENLKKLYPDMSDDEIARISGMIVDDNGNYRSELYQNLYSNKYDLGESKKVYQQGMLLKQKIDEAEDAAKPFSQQDPNSSYKVSYDDKEIGDTTPDTPKVEQNEPVSLDNYWGDFKKKNANKDWNRYTAVEKGKESDYVNIQNPGGNSLYGIKRDLKAEEKGMADKLYSGDWNEFHKKVYKY